jgi:hypothetical protein
MKKLIITALAGVLLASSAHAHPLYEPGTYPREDSPQDMSILSRRDVRVLPPPEYDDQFTTGRLYVAVGTRPRTDGQAPATI